MKRLLFIIVLSLSIISTIFAVPKKNKKEKIPQWLIADSLSEVFPNSQYIARIGYGNTVDEALIFAEGEIGKYFEHTVESTMQASQSMKSSTLEGTSEERSFNRRTLVSSNTKLFAINHTEPYFDKEKKHYSVCVYIDRNEAWKIYEPKVNQKKEAFRVQFDSADEEPDSLKKILRIEKLLPVAEEFIDYLDFAAVIYPQSISSYEKDRNCAALIDEMLITARMDAVMKIEVTGDFENRIKRAVSELFTKENYMLSEREYEYIIKVLVEPNKILHPEEDNIVTANPGITIAISNGSENVFTYTKTLKRISGFNEYTVDKKIYSNLENELKKSFLEEFTNSLK